MQWAFSSSFVNSSGEKKNDTTCEAMNKKYIEFKLAHSITEEGSSQPKTFPGIFIEKVSTSTSLVGEFAI